MNLHLAFARSLREDRLLFVVHADQRARDGILRSRNDQFRDDAQGWESFLAWRSVGLGLAAGEPLVSLGSGPAIDRRPATIAEGPHRGLIPRATVIFGRFRRILSARAEFGSVSPTCQAHVKQQRWFA